MCVWMVAHRTFPRCYSGLPLSLHPFIAGVYALDETFLPDEDSSTRIRWISFLLARSRFLSIKIHACSVLAHAGPLVRRGLWHSYTA